MNRRDAIQKHDTALRRNGGNGLDHRIQRDFGVCRQFGKAEGGGQRGRKRLRPRRAMSSQPTGTPSIRSVW